MLVDALLEHDALPLLVHRLSAFDEKVPAEAAAVYNILAILENMAEVKPEVAELALEKTKVGRRQRRPGGRAHACWTAV